MTERLNPMVGAEYEPNPEDEALAEEIAATVFTKRNLSTSDQPIDITKLGNNRKRKNQLVARLKRRRHYAAPLRGGRGKQARTRRKKFG